METTTDDVSAAALIPEAGDLVLVEVNGGFVTGGICAETQPLKLEDPLGRAVDATDARVLWRMPLGRLRSYVERFRTAVMEVPEARFQSAQEGQRCSRTDILGVLETPPSAWPLSEDDQLGDWVLWIHRRKGLPSSDLPLVWWWIFGRVMPAA